MTCNNDVICFQERVEQHAASGLQAVLLPPLLQHKVGNATKKRTSLDLRILENVLEVLRGSLLTLLRCPTSSSFSKSVHCEGDLAGLSAASMTEVIEDNCCACNVAAYGAFMSDLPNVQLVYIT